MSEGLCILLLPFFSFVLALLFTLLVRRLALRWGYVSRPSAERWHQRPTPHLGGIAFITAWLLALFACWPLFRPAFPIVLVACLAALIGVCDDLRCINPATKLVGQLIAAATAIFFGYSLHFFAWPPLDAILTAFWIVGLTNALNLLDNMDGLAAGIGLIAALYLGVLFFQKGDITHMLLSFTLVGAVAGFLLFNFSPASIFMGDAGSLFLGATLSLLTIHSHGQASNILSLVAVPALILLVPILDTSLVTITRVLRDQPVSQGGKDHSSHRLVVLGLSEPKAVLLLYGMAILSGASALLIERLSYSLSLILVPVVVLVFTLFTAYLAQVEVVPAEKGKAQALIRGLPALLISITSGRRLLEVALDFFLIAFAYYLAFAIRFDFELSGSNMSLYLTSFPVVVTAAYISFFLSGLYRGIWRHTGLEDLGRLARGVMGGTLLAVAALLFFYRFQGYSRAVFVLYPLFLFMGLVGSRLSFRLFDLFVVRHQSKGLPVLIYGAGDGGEMVVRECRKNLRLGYRPIGFLDDDRQKHGQTVLGLPVFGGIERLPTVLEQGNVQGLIISSASILANGNSEKARALCQERDIWMRRLRLEFIED
jgi:UDP-GlcNAc:undecaprenyl-phosphate GlcNAc-1-phosphate transferase